MNSRPNSPGCERSSDLMAFVYNEMSASEAREFETHLQACANCSEEASSFGLVRQSIVSWRDEVLSGFPCPVSDIRLYVSLRLRIDASFLELKRKMLLCRRRPPMLP